VITLGWIEALPLLPTVSVLPEILQLVPDVPVSPPVEMVRCCAKARFDQDTDSRKTVEKINKKGLQAFLKRFTQGNFEAI
jgi:hypothetical protein